jgi:predicted transcriptional regulator
MREVLISIQPRWVEKIVSGEKTVEVRRTRPKCETPFKCYIYCTQGKFKDLGVIGNKIYQKRMKVIGEFVCDRIVQFENSWYDPAFAETSDLSCVGFEELAIYIGKKDFGYGWHITDLVVYDEPRELSEFYNLCDGYCFDSAKKHKCASFNPDNRYSCNNMKPLKRPPQSWCYIEPRQTSD